jgi:hypothetical protein
MMIWPGLIFFIGGQIVFFLASFGRKNKLDIAILTGREEKKKILEEALLSELPELIAVYGDEGLTKHF